MPLALMLLLLHGRVTADKPEASCVPAVLSAKFSDEISAAVGGDFNGSEL